MHGPPLTAEEVQAKLRRHVRRYLRVGVPYRRALLETADDLGVEAYKVFALLGEPDL